ncbi:Similar to GH22027: Ribosome biogenesis protein BOP1 homolog (Drosophila grimshawi) [Cotesia congregata]|uniref:Similar to GH22027: Ribosome biogenesis protein BOP1 homolog (Drosophila grimshawi) n=1 Tax=Cotesia congregata TaxID=51543 RepID=A0A8J2HKG2_COTCN|nr:Similar to GH22027: Ribosome biogenesis protein BOP1 homolog (Drosophila grimshawi) [Cotesia congregata]
MPPTAKKTVKRKLKPIVENVDVRSEESEEDSEAEDLLNAEFNDTVDSSDEEVEESEPGDSDGEVDQLVFDSDESDELEFESDEDDDEEEEDDDEEEEEEEEIKNKNILTKNKSNNLKKQDEVKIKNILTKSSIEENKLKKQEVKIKNISPNSSNEKNNEEILKNKNKQEETLKNKNNKNSQEEKFKNKSEKVIKNKFPETEELKSPDLINITSEPELKDEYEEYDSSDEEDIRNTVGNIPMQWYKEHDHMGYDTEGKKLIKPDTGDELDNFLKRADDPDFWKTVKDPQTGQEVVLTDEDVEIIRKIAQGQYPDPNYNDWTPWVDWFTSKVEKMPLRGFPEHKRSFLPSKLEAKKVSKIVHALKMGWMKSSAELEKERKEKSKMPAFYMLWETDDQAEEMRRIHKHIQAPKRHLPGHAESYNPPPEYLFDKKELKEWNKFKDTPWKRKLHFIPQKYNSLRTVPAYPDFIKERFQRCLDLYMCPRGYKMKLNIDPEQLVPQLPSPQDLQPFPTTLSMVFKGHTDIVRSMTAQNRGQYIASGGDDGNLKIWEVATGRCVKTVPCGDTIRSVAWCPNEAISLIAVAAGQKVLLINPGVGDHLVTSKTDKLMEIIPQSDVVVNERVQSAVQWEQAAGDNWDQGVRVILNHFKIVKQIVWHAKGDYFATVMPDGQNRSVLIHQMSKRRSQIPFKRSKGLIQCVLFHPIRPFLFVAVSFFILI